MKTTILFRILSHDAMPGLSDEILAAAFLAIVLVAGWQLLRRKHS